MLVATTDLSLCCTGPLDSIRNCTAPDFFFFLSCFRFLFYLWRLFSRPHSKEASTVTSNLFFFHQKIIADAGAFFRIRVSFLLLSFDDVSLPQNRQRARSERGRTFNDAVLSPIQPQTK
jgi:hypothetical protein